MDTLLAIGASNAGLALVLAFVTLLITRFRVHPQLAHALWLLVLVKLVTPPVVHLPTPMGWFEESRGDGDSTVETVRESAAPVTGDAPPSADPTPPIEVRTVDVDEAVPTPEASPTEVVVSEADSRDVARAGPSGPVERSSPWPRIRWTSVLAVVWLAGSAVLVCWIVRGAVRVRALLRSSQSAPGDLAQRAAELSKRIGLRRCPRVTVVDATIPPIVWCPGWVPRIVLPAALIESLDSDEVDAVVAHELSHVRRWDHLIRWVEVLAIVAFWWNPVAWYARRRLREAEESCCDAWVVWALPDHRRCYGRTLMKTFEFLTDDRRVTPLAGTAFGGALNPTRIEMIVNQNVRRRLSPGLLIPVLLISACVLPLRAGAPPTAVEEMRGGNDDGSSEPVASEPGDSDPAKPVAGKTIRPGNVNQLGLQSELNRPVRYLDRGPGPDELLFRLRDGVEVVDEASFEVRRRIEKDRVQGFSLSRDRSRSSWVRGKTAFVRDEKSGEIVKFEAGEDPGRPVLSPDNEVVVIGDQVVDPTGGEGAGSVYLRVFDAATGKLIRKLTIVEGAYGALTPVFSPDGNTLAVGNRNYRTNLFDTATWNRRHELPKPMTHEIAFRPDGKQLAVGYVDGTLGICDVETGTVRTVDSGCCRIHSVDWSPDGKLLATSGPSGTRFRPHDTTVRWPGKVQLWDPRTLRVARDLMTVQWSGSVRFSRDGTRLLATVTRTDTLSSGLSVVVWSTNAPPPLDPKPRVAMTKLPVTHTVSLPAVAATTVALSPDGRRIAAPLKNDGRVGIWNVANGKQELVCEGSHDWQIWKVAFSPDGSTVATASLDKTGKLWDAGTGKLRATLTGHDDRLKHLAYGNSGKYVLTGTGKQWPYTKAGPVSARIWDTKTGAQVAELTTHVDTITHAAFTEDDTRVVTASKDHTVRVWDVVSGRELHTFDLGSWVASMQLGPDGRTVLASSSGVPSQYAPRRGKRPQPVVRLWDLRTGELLLDKPHPQLARATFNESGDEILTECRGVITYWNRESGEKLATLRDPLIGTNAVFDPAGRHFVVLVPEGAAELWSVAERKRIRDIDITEQFHSAFSSDGRSFHTVTRSGKFRVWNLDGLN